MKAISMAGDPILGGKTVDGPVSARIRIDGRECINFFGSGYLALSNVPEIRAAVAEALALGAPFMRPVSPLAAHGDPLFDSLEQVAAIVSGTEASVYFASGYFIGRVGLEALKGSFNCLLIDETAHFNLKEAAKLAERPVFEFAHCDRESLSGQLKRHCGVGARPLVLTDGVFATTGRVPPLAEYASALTPYAGQLFIDESHAFGVLGEHGRGAAEHCGIQGGASTGATLGKAYCAQGAFMGCARETAARLRWCPPLRGANSGSPLSAVAATASLRYVAAHPERRAKLRVLSDDLRGRVRKLGYEPVETPAPIVAFSLRTQADMLALQRRLFERGIYVQYSTYLGAGAEGMLRCAVFADHGREDIDALIDSLAA